MRTIEQIDRDIDANRRALMGRLHCDPGMSALCWHNAWDRCPDLHQKETALYRERGLAQRARDEADHKKWIAEKRAAKRAMASRPVESIYRCRAKVSRHGCVGVLAGARGRKPAAVSV